MSYRGDGDAYPAESAKVGGDVVTRLDLDLDDRPGDHPIALL